MNEVKTRAELNSKIEPGPIFLKLSDIKSTKEI